MAHLACPCGNSLSNSCDGDETEYYFVEHGVIEAHQDDFAFFELEYNDLSTEIWKCDVCDRMMFFDGPSARVSRYMRRIDAESLGKDELAREHKSGICFNNLLFNEVDWLVGSKHESNGEPDYEILGNPGEPDERTAVHLSHDGRTNIQPRERKVPQLVVCGPVRRPHRLLLAPQGRR